MKKALIYLITLTLIGFSSCENEQNEDKIPKIEDIEISEDTVYTQNTVELTCIVSNYEINELVYEWTIIEGNYTQTSNKVIWNTPNEKGEYKVICVIRNDQNIEDTKEITINVIHHISSECIALGWIGKNSNGISTENGSVSTNETDGFNAPTQLFIYNDYIFVLDYWNSRITKWNTDGDFIGYIGGGNDGWQTQGIAQSGTDYKSFYNPQGLSFDEDGNIYIADGQNGRVSNWNKDGNAIGWIGGGSNGWKKQDAPNAGTDYQSFDWPGGIYVDLEGNIFVTDGYNNRVCKWDKEGNAIGWIGGGSNGWKTSNGASSGNGLTSFSSHMTDIKVTENGDIFIADRHNHRVCKWDKDGNAIGWIGGDSNGWKTSSGSGDSREFTGFDNPKGIFVTENFIYIAESANNRVSKWTLSGESKGWIGNATNNWKMIRGDNINANNDIKSFNNPSDVFIYENKIYIADENNHRIAVWEEQ